MHRIGSAIVNDWNATQYDRFGDDRQQAARDLLQAVTLTAPAAIADLGCGSGLSTELLRNRYPDAQITGIDIGKYIAATACWVRHEGREVLGVFMRLDNVVNP